MNPHSGDILYIVRDKDPSDRNLAIFTGLTTYRDSQRKVIHCKDPYSGIGVEFDSDLYTWVDAMDYIKRLETTLDNARKVITDFQKIC